MAFFFSTGSIVEGGYYDASDKLPTIAMDGCVFTNCIFMNPAVFGEGCVFVNCVFLDGNDSEHAEMHKTGNGNIFTDCVFNYVQFGENNVSNMIPIGFRPSIIGSNMVLTPDAKTTPSVKLTSCPVCGKVHVVHNGDVVASENMINDNEQVMGGTDVKSSGVCPTCS